VPVTVIQQTDYPELHAPPYECSSESGGGGGRELPACRARAARASWWPSIATRKQNERARTPIAGGGGAVRVSAGHRRVRHPPQVDGSSHFDLIQARPVSYVAAAWFAAPGALWTGGLCGLVRPVAPPAPRFHSTGGSRLVDTNLVGLSRNRDVRNPLLQLSCCGASGPYKLRGR